MNRVSRTVLTKGIPLALLALIAGTAGGGCSRVRERFARSTPAPSVAAHSAQQVADAHYRLGRRYLERSRHGNAAAEFRKALAVQPDSVKFLNALAVALDALGQYADAVRAYTRALELDPSLDYVLNNLGYSHLLSGDRAAAAAAFARALELNPANTVARNNLSRLQGGTDHAVGPVAPVAVPVPGPTQDAGVPPQAVATLEGVALAPAAAPASIPASLPAPATAAPKAVSKPAGAALAPVAAPAATQPAVAAPPLPAAKVQVAAVVTGSTPAQVPAPAATAPKSVAKHERAQPPQAATQAPVPTAAATRPAPVPALSGVRATPPATLLVPVPGARRGSVLLRQISSADLRRETVVEISNGGNQVGFLNEVAAFLVAEGYRVEKGGNEASRAKTAILYRDGALQPAWQVAKSFPGDQEMKKTDVFASPAATVRVLLGRDMIAQRERFAVTKGERLAGTAGH